MRALQAVVACGAFPGARRVGFAGPAEGVRDYVCRGVVLGPRQAEVTGRAVADYVPSSVG